MFSWANASQRSAIITVGVVGIRIVIYSQQVSTQTETIVYRLKVTKLVEPFTKKREAEVNAEGERYLTAELMKRVSREERRTLKMEIKRRATA